MEIKHKEAIKFLGEWRIWFAILFFIIPGANYQIRYIRAPVEDYGGVIPFIINSAYYSLPYFILGFLIYNFLILYNPNKKKWIENKSEFLLITFCGTFLYGMNDLINRIFGYSFKFIFIVTALVIVIFVSKNSYSSYKKSSQN